MGFGVLCQVLVIVTEFLVIVGLRSLFLCWIFSRGFFLFLEVAPITYHTTSSIFKARKFLLLNLSHILTFFCQKEPKLF